MTFKKPMQCCSCGEGTKQKGLTLTKQNVNWQCSVECWPEEVHLSRVSKDYRPDSEPSLYSQNWSITYSTETFRPYFCSGLMQVVKKVTLTDLKLSCSFLTWTGGSLELCSCIFHRSSSCKVLDPSIKQSHHWGTRNSSPDVSSILFCQEALFTSFLPYYCMI